MCASAPGLWVLSIGWHPYIYECKIGLLILDPGGWPTFSVPPRPQYTMSFLFLGSACFASGPKLVLRSVAVIANAVAITNLRTRTLREL